MEISWYLAATAGHSPPPHRGLKGLPRSLYRQGAFLWFKGSPKTVWRCDDMTSENIQKTEHGFRVKLTLLSRRAIGPYRATAELPLYRLYR